jgi:hypothetical protein
MIGGDGNRIVSERPVGIRGGTMPNPPVKNFNYYSNLRIVISRKNFTPALS